MRRFTMLVFALLVLLVGCQKDKPATPAADENEREAEVPAAGSAPDPCTLLTSPELQEVLGEAIDNTERAPSEDPSLAQCIIDTSEYPGRLLISVSRHASEEEARAAFQIEAEGAEPVAGVGDEAYLTSQTGEFELNARKALLIIRLTLVADDPAGRDRLIALTGKALARL